MNFGEKSPKFISAVKLKILKFLSSEQSLRAAIILPASSVPLRYYCNIRQEYIQLLKVIFIQFYTVGTIDYVI